MVRKFYWWVILLIGAQNLFAAPLFTYETFTLKNGLQFILLQNKRAPIVSYTTWFKVGSADETPGKTGLAHYLEHLMESALPEVHMGQFLEDFYSSGTHSNAFTSQDYTYYYYMVVADHLDLLMRYEAGRMRGAAFNQQKFETEKNVILEERLMRIENDPFEFFNEKFNSRFFTVHPYKNPIIGWEKDIRALTFEDIKAFHTKWYHPNNAFVVVSGDFDPQQVRTLAEKYYGDIPAGPKVERNRPKEPLGKRPPPPLILEHPRVSELSHELIYALPNLKKKNYKDLLALLLLSEFLEGDFEGSLHEILVHKKKLATSFFSASSFNQFLDPWSFAISTQPVAESKIKEIETIIFEKLQQIAEKGLSSTDLKRAKKYVYNDLIITLDDIYEKAVVLGAAFASGLTLNQISDLPDDLEKVTSSDIQRVVKEYLLKEKPAIGILKKPVPAQLPKSEKS